MPRPVPTYEGLRFTGHSLRFDLHLPPRIDEPIHRYQAGRRANRAKDVRVSLPYWIGIRDIGDVHARPDDVFRRGACVPQCGEDDLNCSSGLNPWIRIAGSIWPDGCGGRNQYPIAYANRATESDFRFVWGFRGDQRSNSTHRLSPDKECGQVRHPCHGTLRGAGPSIGSYFTGCMPSRRPSTRSTAREWSRCTTVRDAIPARSVSTTITADELPSWWQLPFPVQQPARYRARVFP